MAHRTLTFMGKSYRFREPFPFSAGICRLRSRLELEKNSTRYPRHRRRNISIDRRREHCRRSGKEVFEVSSPSFQHTREVREERAVYIPDEGRDSRTPGLEPIEPVECSLQVVHLQESFTFGGHSIGLLSCRILIYYHCKISYNY